MAELLSSFFILGSDRDTGRAPVQPGVTPPSAASFAADIPRAAGDPGLVGLSLGVTCAGVFAKAFRDQTVQHHSPGRWGYRTRG